MYVSWFQTHFACEVLSFTENYDCTYFSGNLFVTQYKSSIHKSISHFLCIFSVQYKWKSTINTNLNKNDFGS